MAEITWPDTRLCDLLGVDHPIIQAPMAGADSMDLASAVSGSGGLGSIGCGAMRSEALCERLQMVCGATERPVNFNFFCHDRSSFDPIQYRMWMNRLAPYYSELGLDAPPEPAGAGFLPFDEHVCDLVLDCAPKVVSFHFGLPDPTTTDRIKAAGIRILSTATTVEEARWLEARGCDAVIAQGHEAGGHRGMFLTRDIQTQIGTMALVPQIVDAIDLPVIAAGGIGNARGIVAALALGASGVQMGTAFLRCDESGISDVYRANLASGGETVLTNVYSGRPTRVLANEMTRSLGPLACGVPVFPLGFSCSGPLRVAAEYQGLADFSPHYCGQGAALGKSCSARDLLLELVRETHTQLRSNAPVLD